MSLKKYTLNTVIDTRRNHISKPTIFDVTEKERLEQLLKAQAQEIFFLKAVMNNLPASVYWKDKDGIYLGHNTYAAEKMANACLEKRGNRDLIVGKTDYDFFAKDVADEYRKNDLTVMASRNELLKEETVVLPNGQTLIQLSSKKPLYNENNQIVGIIGNTIDITTLKAAEAREQAAFFASAEARIKADIESEMRSAITVLASSIAHELKTPLATIHLTGHSIKKHLPNLLEAYRLAREANLPVSGHIAAFQMESLNKIHDVFESVVRDINDFIATTLKTIQQVTSDKTRPEDLLICNVDKCLTNALDHYLSPEQRAAIVWDRKYPFDFKGNDIQFLRVLFNLINNALYQIDLHKKGKLFISCEDGGDANIMRFKDTAGSVSSDMVARIFEPYCSLKANGTGVGLAFCKMTVCSFGGDITCRIVDGDCIEFVLSFPKLQK